MYESFSPVSLDELNDRAQLMSLFNNKYILSVSRMESLLPGLQPHFDILEISGTRKFEYESCYFDDSDAFAYFHHHQGKRKRIKIRTRKYLDTGNCFVELKLKHKRGLVVKRRIPYAVELYGTLNEEALSFLQAEIKSFYGQRFNRELRTTVSMSFRRTTLVAKQGGERLTIDSDIRFFDHGRVLPLSSELLIVEAKSSGKRGLARQLFQQEHLRPVQRCSKYCLGMSLTNKVSKHNNFRSVMRKLTIIPAVEPFAAYKREPAESQAAVPSVPDMVAA